MSFLMQFKDWVSQSVGIDDACDRLNRKYTSLMLLICVVPLFGKQYIGEPIEVSREGHALLSSSYVW